MKMPENASWLGMLGDALGMLPGENVLLWRMLSGLRIICANNPKIRKGDPWTAPKGRDMAAMALTYHQCSVK